MERIRKRKCFADKDLEEVSQSIQSNEKNVQLDSNLDQKFQENFLNFLIEQQLKQYIINPLFVSPLIRSPNKFQDSQSEEKTQTENDSELIDEKTVNEQTNCLINYSALFSYLMSTNQINGSFCPPENQNYSINSDKQLEKPNSEETNKSEVNTNVITKSNISSKITNFSVEALLSI